MVFKEKMRIAHLSDLHFSKISLRPSQFFSKRWLGNLNLIFSRKREFVTERLSSLVGLFQDLKVDYVLVTGDLTTTSLEEEFAQALAFFKELNGVGIEVFCLPGNHDHYTKKAYKKKLFYSYFSSNFSSSSTWCDLQERGLAIKQLMEGWWLIVLDTALATSLTSSQGFFSPELENLLFQELSSISEKDKVIIANHFPFFHNDDPRKALKRGHSLMQQVQRFPNIKFYLHGHTHRQCIADLRPNHLPVILDSGSTSHRDRGSWNLLEIDQRRSLVQAFQIDPSANEWNVVKERSFEWDHE
jgi:3',5'-cyclic AMP phosphodiesterase CpdA